MITDRKDKYKGFLNIQELDVRTRKGNLVKREVMNRPDAVAALVYDTELKKYIFVNQFRPGASQEIVEIVAGTLDIPNEDYREAIKREILEEIGYETDHIKLIDEFYVSPGGTTEMVSVFYCEVSNKVAEGGGLASENEEIDIIYMDKNQVMSTQFIDAKTIIAVNWLRQN